MAAPAGKRPSAPGRREEPFGRGRRPISSRHRHGRVSMQLRRAAVGVAVVAMVVLAGCDRGGEGSGGGG
jgi:hypothetical protein